MPGFWRNGPEFTEKEELLPGRSDGLMNKVQSTQICKKSPRSYADAVSTGHAYDFNWIDNLVNSDMGDDVDFGIFGPNDIFIAENAGRTLMFGTKFDDVGFELLPVDG